MCGIAGILGVPEELARPAAQRMLEALRHRGPDDWGLEVLADPAGRAPPLVLVHTRLAIVDLSPQGRQPMCHALSPQTSPTLPSTDRASEKLWITFNGEIYNYRALAAEAAAHGLPVRTATDTEAILLAYRLWGESFAERLRGMFAFALADLGRRQVILVRDRLGIKPLYLARAPQGGLLFASEVRALLAAGGELVPRRLSLAAVESFLAQGAVWGEAAHVEGVRLWEPGLVLSCDWEGRELSRRRYWPWPGKAALDPTLDRPAAVTRLRQVLQEAVQQHLAADVPVGVFLSSGVDSAAVAALAAEGAAGRIRTVNVGFDLPQWDESAEAEEIARQLQTEHGTIRVAAGDIGRDLEAVLAAMDQPTVDGFNTWYVSRAARQAGLKVALSGLGGDELFGGYASFRDVPRGVRWQRRLVRWRLAVRWVRRWSQWQPSRRLFKLAELFQRPANLMAVYLLRRELFLPWQRRALWPLPPECDPHSGLPQPVLAALQPHQTDGDSVSSLELNGYLRHMLLRDADVFSLVHALELRVPLLDHLVVEAVLPLPVEWKCDPRLPKRLLADAVGARLPPAVLRRPKRGFTFPWTDWLRGPLAPHAQERLLPSALWHRLGFDPRAVRQLWHRFQQGDPGIGGLHLLALLVLADLVQRQKLTL
ncbi:asparagine synthase (glutamine-hydrolyzing) [Thermogemmata fonticola]|uniref:asparagine synthase (glutamine-hydrolyzing) n=1 Tax=Thermogemmata fonticola TaxID=2755323 RepID=A0A7V8VE21_9BACT|nr:asparagine synthase (glutamine-hydrolyzing) [Thermogemmata fonticola]MBA2226062.1 asparagine synthase (glutamine-hydrolyzing) [Thermogemmata fonticola]